MTEYVFAPPAIASLAIVDDTRRFPVRRILCVGRNYEAHAREMGKDPTREAPFFFLKPADAVADSHTNIPYPPLTQNLHHEIELVVAIGRGGANIALAQALEHVWGYGVGIDLTRRDLQFVARDAGRPWDWGKSFDHSAPIAPLHPVKDGHHLTKGRIWLAVNGHAKQNQDIQDLIWSVPEIIAIASQAMTLAAGDIIMTGTPSGVGPLVRGDIVTGGVAGLGEISINIV